jgi:two-component system sensor histidine kinase SenX3
VAVADILQAAIKHSMPPERLPDLRIACPPDLACRADTTLLSTALGNVLANAAKYSAAGTRIDVAVRANPDAIEIAITDRGVGIAPAEQQAVFAKFQRGSNVLTTTGSGLGLFLARQIMEGHGGSIEVASTAGQGSCFTLRLPALAAFDATAAAASEECT